MISSAIIMSQSKDSWEIDVSSTLKFQNISMEFENSFKLKVMAHFLVVLIVPVHVTYFAGFDRLLSLPILVCFF